jgi:hypothetical protein
VIPEEVRAHYAGLEAVRSYEMLRRFCADRGAWELGEDSGWHQVWIDRARGVSVYALWDANQERVNAELRPLAATPSDP